MKNVNMNFLVKIAADINVQQALDFVESPDCGGVVLFVGNVRNATQGKKVVRLFFECYEPMAIAEMEKIARHTISALVIKRISILHITGEK